MKRFQLQTQYENSQKETLKFRVRGENDINTLLNKIVPRLNELLQENINNKLIKADGCIMKKIKGESDLIIKRCIEEVNLNRVRVSSYMSYGYNSIGVNIKLCYLDSKGFLYYECYKYLVDTDDESKIKRFFPFTEEEQINTDEQIKIYENCLDLLEQLSDEKKKLKPCGLRELVK